MNVPILHLLLHLLEDPTFLSVCLSVNAYLYAWHIAHTSLVRRLYEPQKV